MTGKISTGMPTAGGGTSLPRVPGIAETDLSAQINVTPMIDVMLVLLIIFMVVTPILTQYEATPPTAFTAQPEPDDDVVTLGIDQQGDFYLENAPVGPGQLAARLRQALSDQPYGERVIHLRADRGVEYARVMDAVDAAREAGVATIGAITEPMETDSEEAGG